MRDAFGVERGAVSKRESRKGEAIGAGVGGALAAEGTLEAARAGSAIASEKRPGPLPKKRGPIAFRRALWTGKPFPSGAPSPAIWPASRILARSALYGVPASVGAAVGAGVGHLATKEKK